MVSSGRDAAWQPHVRQREDSGEMADLRASSLETLLQLVGAGFGSTLVPALAMRGGWTSGSGVVTRELELDDAQRRVSLYHRKSFPRLQALHALIAVIMDNLPNTVHPLHSKQST